MTQLVPSINRRTVLRRTIGALGTMGLANTASGATTSALAVSTADPVSVSHCSAALWGSLDDTGGASSVDVTFEFREQGTSTWQTTRTEALSTTASVRHYVDGLTAGTTYEYRLTATASDGDTDTGSTVTVTTDGSTSLKGTTEAATDVTDSTAVLNATLDSFGDGDSASVLFRWGPEAPSGDFPPNTTLQTELTATGSFSQEISGLDPDTTYEYWFSIDGGLDVHRGARRSVTTNAPELDVLTGSALDVFDTGATLHGDLDSLGGADSADLHLDYRQTGATTWTATPDQTLTSAGGFSADVSGLAEETDCEFRAVAVASDGRTDTGATNTFTTTGDPVVTTEEATNVEDTTATLAGSLSSEGGADSHDVFFEWGPEGDLSNTATDVFYDSITPSIFYADVSGLDPTTTYEFRAMVDASDGDSDSGSIRNFTTTEPTDDNVAVDTEPATDVTDSSATLQGVLNDLGGADSADVSFEWRVAGTNDATETSTQTLTATGRFSEGISGLSSDTFYEYRALATASDGDVDASAWSSFKTEQGSDEAPVVDSFSVSEAGSPNPHAKITADWVVSDVDGDLDSVVVEVLDGGSVVDSATTQVSGGSASGTDVFEIKHGGGTTYDVELTVTDESGLTATETRTVTAP
mgnify:CR=1 FL=1